MTTTGILETIIPFLVIITIGYFLTMSKKKKVYEKEWNTKGIQSQLKEKIINDFCNPSNYKIVKEEENIIVYKAGIQWTHLVKEVHIEIQSLNNNNCNIKTKFIFTHYGKLSKFNDDLVEKNINEDISSIKNIIGSVIIRKSENDCESIISSKEIAENLHKYYKLFKNDILTEREYEEKKYEQLKSISPDKINENIEDFLSNMLDLINMGMLNTEDLKMIKSTLL